jgi:hypothetical protein
LKVVHISDFPLSGAPYRLAEVQRLQGLEARLLNHVDRYDENRVYPHDLLMSAEPGLIAHLLESADVIHFHNQWRNGELFRLHPWAWDVVRRKPCVIQFHTPREEHLEEGLGEPSLLKLVVAQYQVRFYPECRPVPNVVPIDDALHSPAGAENDPPVIAYTPGNCDRTGWRSKGCAETLAVLERGFRYRFVTGVPWTEAMAVKRPCDIAIDEVVTGSYHLCSLEALSLGLATIAGLDERTVDALEAVTGTREHPWIVARPDTLHGELARLVADGDYRRAKRREGRAYMERHWNPARVVARFVDVYAEALGRHAG